MNRRPGRLRLAALGGQRRAGRGLTDCSNPYGLTTAELRAEIRRLTARGWQLSEIRQRLCPCKNSETSE